MKRYKRVGLEDYDFLGTALIYIRQSIEHAGYHRDILRRNPKRYDEDGDELSDDFTDEEADARAAEDNPYAEVRLEGEQSAHNPHSDLR